MTIENNNKSRGRSRTAATSKMQLFVTIVSSYQPLTIITKCSILDVAAVLDLPLITLNTSLLEGKLSLVVNQSFFNETVTEALNKMTNFLKSR